MDDDDAKHKWTTTQSTKTPQGCKWMRTPQMDEDRANGRRKAQRRRRKFREVFYIENM